MTSPDGTVGYTSSGWQAILANGGRPLQAYRKPPWIEARGWYTGTEYENARFTSPMPSGPLQGNWTFNVSLAPGSGGTPVNHVLVSLDPHFHFDPVDRGNVIFEKAGPYVGPITIDTTKLSNGVHRLFMRTDSPVAAGTGSGVLAFNFTVNNPGIGLLAPLSLAADAIKTSLPVLPSLIILVVVALIMPRRSTRRRVVAQATRSIGTSDGAVLRSPAAVLDTVAAVGSGASHEEPMAPVARVAMVSAVVSAPTAPVPEAAQTPTTRVAETAPAPTSGPTAPVPETVVPGAAQSEANPAARPMPMSREEAWAEYRRATTAASTRQALAAATLEWVRAVDRIKRAEADG